jgi:hypothetical protein
MVPPSDYSDQCASGGAVVHQRADGSSVWVSADVSARRPEHPSFMRQSTYAVWWQEDDGPRHAGKLQIGSLHLLLSGNGSGRVAVPLDEIVEVAYRRGLLHIERRRGRDLRIGNLDGPGVLLELSDALAA